jgi:hypothetical protein
MEKKTPKILCIIPSFIAFLLLALFLYNPSAHAASSPFIDAETFSHSRLGRLVSLPAAVAPKWGKVREELERTVLLKNLTAALGEWRSWAVSHGLGEEGGIGRLAEDIRQRLTGVRYREDAAGDYWQTPAETLQDMAGDCEDQAILGLFLALAAGASPDESGLAVGYDRFGRPHAVLVLFDSSQVLIVDINEPRVEELAESGFSPRMIAFVDHVWVARGN